MKNSIKLNTRRNFCVSIFLTLILSVFTADLYAVRQAFIQHLAFRLKMHPTCEYTDTYDQHLILNNLMRELHQILAGSSTGSPKTLPKDQLIQVARLAASYLTHQAAPHPSFKILLVQLDQRYPLFKKLVLMFLMRDALHREFNLALRRLTEDPKNDFLNERRLYCFQAGQKYCYIRARTRMSDTHNQTSQPLPNPDVSNVEHRGHDYARPDQSPSLESSPKLVRYGSHCTCKLPPGSRCYLHPCKPKNNQGIFGLDPDGFLINFGFFGVHMPWRFINDVYETFFGSMHEHKLIRSLSEVIEFVGLTIDEQAFLLHPPYNYLSEQYVPMRRNLLNCITLCANRETCQYLKAYPEFGRGPFDYRYFLEGISSKQAVHEAVRKFKVVAGRRCPFGGASITNPYRVKLTDFLSLETLSSATLEARCHMCQALNTSETLYEAGIDTWRGDRYRHARIELLQQFHLYQHQEYLAFVRTFSEYEVFIDELYDRMQRDPQFYRALKKTKIFNHQSAADFVWREKMRIQQEQAQYELDQQKIAASRRVAALQAHREQAEQRNLNVRMEDIDPSWSKEFDTGPVRDVTKKYQDARGYSREEIERLCDKYNINAKFFTRPQVSPVLQNNLIRLLDALEKREQLSSDEKNFIKDSADLAVSLDQQDKRDLSEAVIDSMYATAHFFMGVSGEFVKTRAIQHVAHWSLRALSNVSLPVTVNPYVATAVGVGYVGYQAYQNISSITEKIHALRLAHAQGQYYELGKLATNVGFEIFDQSAFFKNVINVFKNHNALDALSQGVGSAAKVAAHDQNIQKSSQDLYHTFTQSDFYTQALKNLEHFNMSLQAFQRRAEKFSWNFACPQIIQQRFEHFQKLLVYQRRVMINGLGKLAHFNFDHLFMVDVHIKNGNIVKLGGFHADPGGLIKQAGKVKVFGRQEGIAGIYRAMVGIGGESKESSFFPDNMSYEQILDLLSDLLKNADPKKFLKQNDGKIIYRPTTQFGYDVVFEINPHTGEVLTAYPFISEWAVPLRKILFGKGK